MGNAAYLAPISPRPLPTNVRQHGTARGVNLSLWTSLATLPARHTLWSTHIPEEPNCAGVVQRSWVVNSHIDLATWNDVYWLEEDDIATASRV
jgi:hypothetical protein